MSSKNPPAALGQYLILEELGAGSFARVFRCEHMFTHEKFAGKLYEVDFAISEEGCKLLRKEISILKILRHPGVIRFHEMVSDKSWILIVMELVEGRTLLNVMPPSGGLPESFARPVLKQILDAMVFLHCNGVVHRDIKLENVMIQHDGSVKIIDFGLADHVPEEYAKEGLLIDGQCGSPHYYAPEMILANDGDMFRGDKVDIWAVGVLLYSLVTGYHPFFAESKDKDALFRQIVSEEVSFENTISPGMKDLLKKILVKTPSRRVTLLEIYNHPWTNNTFLAQETVGWIRHQEAENLHSRPALASLPPQNVGSHITAKANIPMPSRERESTLRSAPAPPGVNPSNLSVDNRRKTSPGNNKSQTRKEVPLSTEGRKTSTVSSIGFDSKLWKRVKHYLEKIVRNSRKRESSDEQVSSVSENLNSSTQAMNGDDDSKRTMESADDSDLFVSETSLKRRTLKQRKEDSHRSARICKISFACWINV